MNHEAMFETATRKKFRFPYRGQITVEDLWKSSPEVLNEVYKNLKSEMSEETEDSLIPAKEETDLQMKIEIVKYIYQTLEAEHQAAKCREQNANKKQQILEIIQSKENENLHSLSIEELKAIAESL